MSGQLVIRQIQQHHRCDAVVGIILAVIEYVVPLRLCAGVVSHSPVIRVLHLEQRIVHFFQQGNLSVFESVHLFLCDLVAAVQLELSGETAVGQLCHNDQHCHGHDRCGHHCNGTAAELFRLQIRAFQRSAARHRISQRSQHQHQRHPERRNGKGNGRIQLYALQDYPVPVIFSGKLQTQLGDIPGKFTGDVLGILSVLDQRLLGDIEPIVHMGGIRHIQHHLGLLGVLPQLCHGTDCPDGYVQIVERDNALVFAGDGQRVQVLVQGIVPGFHRGIRGQQNLLRIVALHQMIGRILEHRQLQHGHDQQKLAEKAHRPALPALVQQTGGILQHGSNAHEQKSALKLTVIGNAEQVAQSQHHQHGRDCQHDEIRHIQPLFPGGRRFRRSLLRCDIFRIFGIFFRFCHFVSSRFLCQRPEALFLRCFLPRQTQQPHGCHDCQQQSQEKQDRDKIHTTSSFLIRRSAVFRKSSRFSHIRSPNMLIS